MKKENKGKLAAAVAGLMCSAAVLGMGSYAWFTLSTNPEITGMSFSVAGDETMYISNDEGKTFSRLVDISNDFADQTELKPVSTMDGLKWYVCDYDVTTGNIKNNLFFEKDWCVSEEHGNPDKHPHCDNGGFYAYTDIWVKAETDFANIRISTPAPNNPVYDYLEEETSSGSYVLSYGVTEKKGEGGKVSNDIKLLQQGPETCARIGLMIFEPTGEENPVVLKETEDAATKEGISDLVEKFVIFEPNADMRSELDKQSDEYRTDIYVSGYTGKASPIQYKNSNGKYIQTYPIKAGQPDTMNLEEPKEGDYDETLGKLVVASPAVFNPENLVVQTNTSWKHSVIEAAAKEDATLLKVEDIHDLSSKILSNQFVDYGRFVMDPSQFLYDKTKTGTFVTGGNNDYKAVELSKTEANGTTSFNNGAGNAASQIIFTLEKDQVRQIRLFFWMEGQDVDCWNDVAGMNFLARIEFSTEVAKKTQ